MLQAKQKEHSPSGNNTTAHCGHRGHKAFLITLSNKLLETKPIIYSYEKDKKPYGLKLQAVLNGPLRPPPGRDAAATLYTELSSVVPPNRRPQTPLPVSTTWCLRSITNFTFYSST